MSHNNIWRTNVMLQKHKTIIDVIIKTIILPLNIELKAVSNQLTNCYSSISFNILDTTFTVLLSDFNYQVMVYSDKHCQILLIDNEQWDSVLIGQKLGNAIQKWININIESQFVKLGYYGYKITNVKQVGIFVFLVIDCYNKNNTIECQQKTIHFKNSIVGTQASILLDLFGANDCYDSIMIPTSNTSMPDNNIVDNDYYGLNAELEEIFKYCLNTNKSKL